MVTLLTFGTFIVYSLSNSAEELIDLYRFARANSIFLLNFISFLYFCLKFYTVLCYTKITFEWLPMINPYAWPFSIFQVITRPYYAFWSKIMPPIKFEKSSFEVSAMVGLIALNSVSYLFVRIANVIVIYLDYAEKTISTLTDASLV